MESTTHSFSSAEDLPLVDHWNLCGKKVSRSAVVFFCQIIILYISILTCFVNLTVKNGPTELWISILSLSLGSILPSPKVKKPSLSRRNATEEDVNKSTSTSQV